MYCRNCGTKLKDNANFCTNCGEKVKKIPENNELEKQGIVKSAAEMQTIETKEDPYISKANDKTILGIIIGTMTLSMILIFIASKL